MRPHSLLSFLFAVILVTGCTEFNESNYSEVSAEVQSDPIFKELMKTENQHMIAVAKDEYGHSTMQSRLIENESKQCKSGKDFINLYNKAGMKNTEQYFEITNRILSLKNDVLKNHPKIMALNRRDRNKLFVGPKITTKELQEIATARNSRNGKY